MEFSELYRQMMRARAYEVAVEKLWNDGLISGEMHLGTGEEAVAAGVVSHLRDGDGLSLTHRCSPALVVRGVPLVPMLKELLGREDGLCKGRGGHMQLFSKAHLAATSGIVGASIPLGAGFALSAKRLRKDAVGVAFIGDGAMNQGMAMEAMNLAVAWQLPFLVVCIDNGWAITTPAGTVTGGDLSERAKAFGFSVDRADGTNVEDVHRVSGALLQRTRRGKGPAFLYSRCPRMDGHFLGDLLVRMSRSPVKEGKETIEKIMSSAMSSGGGGFIDRAGSMAKAMSIMSKARNLPTRGGKDDPIGAARKSMKKHGGHEQIDAEVQREIDDAVRLALQGTSEVGHD